MNGKKIKHGFDYSRDYYPDLIANDSVAFLRQSKHNFARKPVMLVASFPAPHGPEDSAPQFSHLFFNVTTHQWVRRTFWLFRFFVAGATLSLAAERTRSDSYRRDFFANRFRFSMPFARWSAINSWGRHMCTHVQSWMECRFPIERIVNKRITPWHLLYEGNKRTFIRFRYLPALRLMWNLIEATFRYLIGFDNICILHAGKIKYIASRHCVKHKVIFWFLILNICIGSLGRN